MVEALGLRAVECPAESPRLLLCARVTGASDELFGRLEAWVRDHPEFSRLDHFSDEENDAECYLNGDRWRLWLEHDKKQALLGLGAETSEPFWVVCGIEAPTLIRDSKTEPVYPAKAFATRAVGRVVLYAVIGSTGAVESVEVLRSSNPGYGFEKSAARAVRRWRYQPARLDGRPVSTFFTVAFDFSFAADAPAHVSGQK